MPASPPSPASVQDQALLLSAQTVFVLNLPLSSINLQSEMETQIAMEALCFFEPVAEGGHFGPGRVFGSPASTPLIQIPLCSQARRSEEEPSRWGEPPPVPAALLPGRLAGGCVVFALFLSLGIIAKGGMALWQSAERPARLAFGSKPPSLPLGPSICACRLYGCAGSC